MVMSNTRRWKQREKKSCYVQDGIHKNDGIHQGDDGIHQDDDIGAYQKINTGIMSKVLMHPGKYQIAKKAIWYAFPQFFFV